MPRRVKLRPVDDSLAIACGSTVQRAHDLLGNLAGREPHGVDDLGLLVQPSLGRLGIRLEVLKPKWGVGAEDAVASDALAEGLLVGMQDEVPDRDVESPRVSWRLG